MRGVAERVTRRVVYDAVGDLVREADLRRAAGPGHHPAGGPQCTVAGCRAAEVSTSAFCLILAI